MSRGPDIKSLFRSFGRADGSQKARAPFFPTCSTSQTAAPLFSIYRCASSLVVKDNSARKKRSKRAVGGSWPVGSQPSASFFPFSSSCIFGPRAPLLDLPLPLSLPQAAKPPAMAMAWTEQGAPPPLNRDRSSRRLGAASSQQRLAAISRVRAKGRLCSGGGGCLREGGGGRGARKKTRPEREGRRTALSFNFLSLFVLAASYKGIEMVRPVQQRRIDM